MKFIQLKIDQFFPSIFSKIGTNRQLGLQLPWSTGKTNLAGILQDSGKINISCKFLADTIISCNSLADQIKSCKILARFLQEMIGFPKKFARKTFPCKNLPGNMLAFKFQYIGLRVEWECPYGDVCFFRRFRDIFSLIAHISETIEPTASALVPKVLQSRELHFCRKEMKTFRLFGLFGRNILRTSQLIFLVILSEKVLHVVTVRPADWDKHFSRLKALFEKYIRRISTREFWQKFHCLFKTLSFFI